MRKSILIAAVALSSCFFSQRSHAQIHFNVGINIGSQPDWGPVGYDHADYYYMPDIGVYYDVPAHQYIYLSNNAWIRSPYLPDQYRGYDLYHSYKVVINQPRPWVHDYDYRERYARYRGRHDQMIIRDSRDERYREHWHDNGRHEGWNHQDNGRGNHGDHGNHGDNGNHGDHGDHGDNGNHGDHGDHGNHGDH